MPVAWYPSRWWNWCLLEDEKKGIEPIERWQKLLQGVKTLLVRVGSI